MVFSLLQRRNGGERGYSGREEEVHLETGAGQEIFSAEDSFLRGKLRRGGDRCVLGRVALEIF